MTKVNSIFIAQKLRTFIQKNNLQPEDRLPTHSELLMHFKVGLRPLREAMSILKQDDIIETRRRGGTFVKKPSLEIIHRPINWLLEEKGYTYQHIVKARAIIESAIAAEAATKRTARDLLKMLDAIEQFESHKSDTEETEDIDISFHLVILEATHNPAILLFGQLISEQFDRKRKSHIITSNERISVVKSEHRSIYRSIEKCRPESTRKQMYEHILLQLKMK